MVNVVGEPWQCVNCVSVSPEVACVQSWDRNCWELVVYVAMSGCNDVCIPPKKRLHTDVALFHGGLSGSALTTTSAIPPKYSPRTLIAVLPARPL